MKAKVKATNEIVDVFHLTQHGQITGLYKELMFLEGRMWTEDELDFSINSKSKVVDLEKELEMIKGDYEQVDVAWKNDFDFIAKHFYELGLKAKGN